MTFQIIKKRQIAKANKEVSVTVVNAIIDGMVDDSVVNLHTAVEAANAAVPVDEREFDGNVIEPVFKQLKKELVHLNAEADRLLAETGSITDTGDAIRELETNFKFADIKTMKTEVYGSPAEWKKSMTASEV